MPSINELSDDFFCLGLSPEIGRATRSNVSPAQAILRQVATQRHFCKESVFHSFDPLWCRHVLMKVSISRGPLPRLIIRGAPRHPELRHPDARPDRVWRLDPRRLYVHEFAQLAVYVADVITVQARHIIERRPASLRMASSVVKTFSA